MSDRLMDDLTPEEADAVAAFLEKRRAEARFPDWTQPFGPEGSWHHKNCRNLGSYIIFHYPPEDPRHASGASCSYCSAHWSAENDWRKDEPMLDLRTMVKARDLLVGATVYDQSGRPCTITGKREAEGDLLVTVRVQGEDKQLRLLPDKDYFRGSP